MKIETLPSGNKRIRIYYTTPTGEKKTKSVTASTNDEVMQKATDFLKSINKIAPKTLRDACEIYIKSRENVLSPNTVREYRRTMIRLDGFLDRPVDLSEEELQIFVNNLSLSVAPKTVRNYAGFIVSVIGMVYPQKTFRLKYPQKTKPQDYIPTDDDVNKLLDAVKGTNLELPVLLASQMGLRRSEICALDYSDIRDGKMYINKALARNEDNIEVKKGTKSYDSNRVLDCTDSVLHLIEQQKTEGKPFLSIRMERITTVFPKVLDKIGVPRFKFHALRHYYISVCIKLGIPLFYIQRLVGHSTDDLIQRVYGHIMDDKNKSINAQIKDFFAQK